MMRGIRYNAEAGVVTAVVPPPCASNHLVRLGRCRRHTTRAVNSDQDVSWDPEGLFKNQRDRVSVFREKHGDEPGTSADVPTLDDAFLRKYPIRPMKGTLSDLKRFKRTLTERYMPLNVDHPNTTILHLDPPIFLVDQVCSICLLPARRSWHTLTCSLG